MIRTAKWMYNRLAGIVGGDPCPACGRPAPLQYEQALSDALAEAWALDSRWRRWFDEREGLHCGLCRASLRARQLAAALVQYFQQTCETSAKSLAAACADPRCAALEVAEINGAGRLHRHLERLPNLAYSEYKSADSSIPSEDLLQLSYANARFDLVITSETLEHVPDVDRALAEIRRVLKPGGAHIFTVPIIEERPHTRQRARLGGDGWIHDLPPSYHGALNARRVDMLVVYEFGADFAERVRSAGFTVDALRADDNPALVTFIARRTSP